MDHVKPVASPTVEQEFGVATHDSHDDEATARRYGPPAGALSEGAEGPVETRRQLEVWG
jgi:hypothetical protein